MRNIGITIKARNLNSVFIQSSKNTQSSYTCTHVQCTLYSVHAHACINTEQYACIHTHEHTHVYFTIVLCYVIILIIIIILLTDELKTPEFDLDTNWRKSQKTNEELCMLGFYKY